MKRFWALMTALILALTPSFALEAAQPQVTEEARSNGVTVYRNHLETTTEKQQIALDYPSFECDDPAFAEYLRMAITSPIQSLASFGQMADASAYADGKLDSIRGGYCVSLDFDGIMSVEASVRNQPAGAASENVSFFYSIVDLNGKRVLTIKNLFTEPASAVDEAICSAVFAKASEMGILLETITDSGVLPLPNSYYITRDVLRTLYAADSISAQAAVIDIPWEDLPLTWSPVLSGKPQETPTPTAAPTLTPKLTQEPVIIGGADGPTSIFVAETVDQETAEELTEKYGLMTPAPVLTPEVSPTPTPMTTVTPFPVETLVPDYSLAPVVTPTPMPVTGNDSILVDVLAHGLWKPLGGEGDVYYQFTEDGKLLTVTVSSYEVKDRSERAHV